MFICDETSMGFLNIKFSLYLTSCVFEIENCKRRIANLCIYAYMSNTNSIDIVTVGVPK